tara:strand:- start:2342 stop:2614 length:273 start_codon:yes stop_codon:yes gene_type:complete
MLESAIQKDSIKAAKELGWYSFKVLSTLQRGLPDCCFIKDGDVVFIEFKTDKGKLSPMQVKIHKKFKEHGVTVYVSRSKEETIRVLDEIK